MISENSLNAALTAYDIEAECIKGLKEHFDRDVFSAAVELLKNAPRIGASGCGHSGIICQHFAHRKTRKVYISRRSGSRRHRFFAKG